ncbi:MAG: FAD-binding oxidoreductase [SAR86 cluster bacterium]|uniref:D-2-hydroxyglutarate dehydrogenase n=1 Tax=SAR86 cluster bacterium TaxID=2030880 RepID=A0A2A4MU26_9GAMM|nr:MAG: FAD-binding oxidoreductase [SAR86 cluster bacterium]
MSQASSPSHPPLSESTTARLSQIVGADRVLLDSQSLQDFGKDWTKVYAANPRAIVFPANAEQVQALVKLANELSLPIVPSGGRTGLSGGAVASDGEIVMAFDRMNKILDFNAIDRQVVCEAGVITEQLQQFAEQQGLFYPVDFASSGSSQIGGNVATNAGGIKVIRYGLTRNWVLGMKVVTGKGDLLEFNKGLAKNATGYDFRHLFIGSEGTLGLIVEVTLGLCSAPKDPCVLVLGVEQLSGAMEVLQLFQEKMQLSAFEFFSEQALQHVIDEKQLQRPFESKCPFYALIEFENPREDVMEQAMALFETCVESGWVVDGVISQSTTQAANLWRLREDISETIAQFTPYKNDISVKVSQIPAFLAEVDELVGEAYPDFEIIWFGHIGDGNVHLNILKPEQLAAEQFFEKCAHVSRWVGELVEKYGGSISAEHGVGLLKKPFLTYSRSPLDIAYMQAVKAVFDPKGILNPGKIFDPE